MAYISEGKHTTYLIFLASSKSLEQERNEFLKDINVLNKSYSRFNISFELVLWEQLSSGIKPEGKQKYYNKELAKCDFLVLIYWGEIGPFTAEEFRTAFKLLDTSGKPQIFPFKKIKPILSKDLLNVDNVENLNTIELELNQRNQWVFEFDHYDTALKKFSDEVRQFIDNKHQLRASSQEPEIDFYDNLIRDITLFGRDDDVKMISECLYNNDVGLITLFGAGGTGKSSLANRVAHENKANFKNGAIFVELAPLTEEKMIAPSIFNVFNNIKLELSENIENQLINFLKDKQIIIILDNCEYLITACARLASEINKKCPRVKIIATTQIILKTAYEKVIHVGPLEKPQEGSAKSHRKIESNPCIELFMSKAKNADPKFKLSERTREDVIEICKLRAGIPLGIILAASALNLKSVEDIRMGIAEHLQSSGEHYYDDVPHHRSIAEAVDWSYNLLDKRQKALFVDLSLFRDDFTEEAAKAITNNLPDFDANFERLINNSMLTRSSSRFLRSKTFFILEPLRHYGIKKFEKETAHEVAIKRFIEYYKELSRSFFRLFFTGQQANQFKLIEEQYNNLIEAINLAKKLDDWASAGEICCFLWRFWEVKSQFREGVVRIENVIEKENISPETYLELYHGLGMLYYRGGEISIALQKFEGHLNASQHYANMRFGRVNVAHALNNISNVKTNVDGKIEEAKNLLLRAYEIFTELGDDRMIAVCQNNLGTIYKTIGSLNEALIYYSESAENFEKQQNFWESGYPLYGLGTVYFQMEKFDDAKTAFIRAYARRESVGDKRNLGRCEYYLAFIELKQGNLKACFDKLEKSHAFLSDAKDDVSLLELYLITIQYCFEIGLYGMAVQLYALVITKEKSKLFQVNQLAKTVGQMLIGKIRTNVSREEFETWEKKGPQLNESEVFNKIKKFKKK